MLHITLQRTLVEVIPVLGLLVSQACDSDAFNRGLLEEFGFKQQRTQP